MVSKYFRLHGSRELKFFFKPYSRSNVEGCSVMSAVQTAAEVLELRRDL